MQKFGIFSDEGMIDGGFDSFDKAVEAMRKADASADAKVRASVKYAKIAIVCPYHDDEPDDDCEQCDEEYASSATRSMPMNQNQKREVVECHGARVFGVRSATTENVWIVAVWTPGGSPEVGTFCNCPATVNLCRHVRKVLVLIDREKSDPQKLRRSLLSRILNYGRLSP